MKASHHPDVFTSASGRNEETSRPNVGMVHRTQRAITMTFPQRLESEALTARPTGSPPIAASTVVVSGSAPDAIVVASIGSATTLELTLGLMVLMTAPPPVAVHVGS